MLSSLFESSSKTLRRDSSFCTISDGCDDFVSKLISFIEGAVEGVVDGVAGVEGVLLLPTIGVPVADSGFETTDDPDHFSYLSSKARKRSSSERDTESGPSSFSESLVSLLSPSVAEWVLMGLATEAAAPEEAIVASAATNLDGGD